MSFSPAVSGTVVTPYEAQMVVVKIKWDDRYRRAFKYKAYINVGYYIDVFRQKENQNKLRKAE